LAILMATALGWRRSAMPQMQRHGLEWRNDELEDGLPWLNRTPDCRGV
jgi:hypothetical protein